jgi:hypothetical protein
MMVKNHIKICSTHHQSLKKYKLGQGDGGGNLTKVQCKAIGNWHKESPHIMNLC